MPRKNDQRRQSGTMGHLPFSSFRITGRLTTNGQMQETLNNTSDELVKTTKYVVRDLCSTLSPTRTVVNGVTEAAQNVYNITGTRVRDNPRCY